MSVDIFKILMALLAAVGAVFLVHCIYFFIVALFGLKKQKPPKAAQPTTRFAVLVAARNEAEVIGHLVDSLKQQDYPRALYDIIVAPNNCTDNTRDIALAHGATIFDPVGAIGSKGEVLHQLCETLDATGKYDAYCVFDADNLVHPGFLQVMNDAVVSGIHAAQGYRDSKNPADSIVSTCSSVSYWIVNRFYNGGREKLGLSSLIHGCGFMFTTQMLRRLGGWNTHTMTEDYEFTAQCVLAGQRVHYISGAIFYDEQPLTFRQSWRQRKRWGVGYVQVARGYLDCLIKQAIACRDFKCFDLALTVVFPLTQPLTLLLGMASVAMVAYGVIRYHLIPMAVALFSAVAGPFAAFVGITLLAAFVVMLSRGNLRGTLRGIAFFALFQLTWLPISIYSLFKKDIKWEAVGHTRGVAMGQITRR